MKPRKVALSCKWYVCEEPYFVGSVSMNKKMTGHLLIGAGSLDFDCPAGVFIRAHVATAATLRSCVAQALSRAYGPADAYCNQDLVGLKLWWCWRVCSNGDVRGFVTMVSLVRWMSGVRWIRSMQTIGTSNPFLPFSPTSSFVLEIRVYQHISTKSKLRHSLSGKSR